jgi:hypothetical protein
MRIWFEWPYGEYRLGFENVAVGRINGAAALTGFSYNKLYGLLAGTKKGP